MPDLSIADGIPKAPKTANRPKRHDIKVENPRPPGERGQGPKPFVPTKEQRDLVQVLRGAGVPMPDIAMLLKCSVRTLHNHFREELDHGKAMVVARVGARVVQKALAGDNGMMVFYLRAMGGETWADKHKHELTGANGAPLAPPNLVVSFLTAENVGEPATPELTAERSEYEFGDAALGINASGA